MIYFLENIPFKAGNLKIIGSKEFSLATFLRILLIVFYAKTVEKCPMNIPKTKFTHNYRVFKDLSMFFKNAGLFGVYYVFLSNS